jgi:hypothetical protein
VVFSSEEVVVVDVEVVVEVVVIDVVGGGEVAKNQLKIY